MPTRWPNYILVILTAFLGWIVTFSLPHLWRFMGGSTKRPAEVGKRRRAASPGTAPISVRFHLAALLFLGFLGFVFLEIPFLFVVKSAAGDLASLLLVAIAIPTAIALFYCLRKGDLSWSAPRTRVDAGDEGREE